FRRARAGARRARLTLRSWRSNPELLRAHREYLAVHVVGGACSVDHADPLRVFASESEESLPYAFVEARVFAFEAIGRGVAAPAPGASQADLDRTIEHEGEIGQQTLARHGLDG